MAATFTYNICYCSECESGSSVSDTAEESSHNNHFHVNPVRSSQLVVIDCNNYNMEPDALSLPNEISNIRKIYNLDETLTPYSGKLPTNKIDHDKQVLIGNLQTLSSFPSTDTIETSETDSCKSKKTNRKKSLKKCSAIKFMSDDSDTMQEEAEFSSTTNQELDQAWDVYQEPLYATGSDVAEEERLDPSSLIEDWDGSMDEENHEPVKQKGDFDWSEESDSEDINKLIEDSRMQLKIIKDVIRELECDYLSVSCSDYIESCATCNTNIGCLENLFAALNKSMDEVQADNEYMTSLIELIEDWQKTLQQLEEIERPKQMGQKSKVRKRLRKKKMFRKFSCDSKKESMESERLSNGCLASRSGSLPEVEFIEPVDQNENNHSIAVTSQHIEGDTKLMSALFFGLIALILAIKIGYSCFYDIDMFSFDVTFFLNYLRENPPA